MMNPIAQFLILSTKLPAEVEPKKITAAPPEYRRRCNECDDEGIDARIPCEGHN